MKKKTKIEGFDEETSSLLHLDDFADEEKRPKKRMFLFKDFGLVIPVWSILTIEKIWKMTNRPARPIYGFVLNRGVEISSSCPIGEKEFWYEKETIRDKRFDEILGVMQENNFLFSVL